MPAIPITPAISIELEELHERGIRASGPGGQHVNTTDTAIELRFNALGSLSLPKTVKERLATLAGSRLTQDGWIIIQAQTERSQELNRREARERLFTLIREAAVVPKKRRRTKPSRAAKARRLDAKKKRGSVKAMRGRVDP